MCWSPCSVNVMRDFSVKLVRIIYIICLLHIILENIIVGGFMMPNVLDKMYRISKFSVETKKKKSYKNNVSDLHLKMFVISTHQSFCTL